MGPAESSGTQYLTLATSLSPTAFNRERSTGNTPRPPTPAICDWRSGGYPPAVVVAQSLVAIHSVQPEPAVFHQSPDIRVTPDHRFNAFRRCIDHHRKAHRLVA